MSTICNHPTIGILLVEDNPVDRHLATRYLSHGLPGEFVLHSAARLAEAIQIATREAIDLVLLDLGLPDSMGLSGVERLRERLPMLPIVVLSGSCEHQLALEAVRSGAQDYLPKADMNPDSLARTIRFTLERQHRFEAERTQAAELRRAKERAEDLAFELGENRERLELALHATQLIMWDWSLVDDETEFSDGLAAILGYDAARQSPPPQRWQDLVHPDERENVLGRITRFLISPWGQYEDTFRMRAADGSSRSVIARGRVIGVNMDGEPLRMVGTFLDVTERQVIERQLVQAQKLEAIGQLAAGIAHEINTPMQYLGDNINYLQGALQSLQPALVELQAMADADLPAADAWQRLRSAASAARLPTLINEVPAALSDCQDGIHTVARIVRAMKEFSHPGSEDKTPVDLNAAIETTITVARNQWKYVADVELELDPHLPLVPALPGELNQVLLNIIVNAAHAIGDAVGSGSGGKGTITISSRRGAEHVEIRVRDTGCGIPKQLQSRIFEPFFTTKDVGKGTGQGLAIAHNVIVHKHGGSVTFESQVGVGTTFIVRLPLAAAEDAVFMQDESAHAVLRVVGAGDA